MTSRERSLRMAAEVAMTRITELLTDVHGNAPHPSHLEYIRIQIAEFGKQCAPQGGTARAACVAIIADADEALRIRSDQASALVAETT